MQLRYSFRLYPNGPQRSALARVFGCARVVYNDALRARETARAGGEAFPKTGDLSKLLITEAKKTASRRSMTPRMIALKCVRKLNEETVEMTLSGAQACSIPSTIGEPLTVKRKQAAAVRTKAMKRKSFHVEEGGFFQ